MGKAAARCALQAPGGQRGAQRTEEESPLRLAVPLQRPLPAKPTSVVPPSKGNKPEKVQ